MSKFLPFDVSQVTTSSFVPRLLTVNDDLYSFSSKGLFVKKSGVSIWEQLETPFELLDGMSITSCGTFLVFFGGIQTTPQNTKRGPSRERARYAEKDQTALKRSPITDIQNMDYSDPNTNFSYYMSHKYRLLSHEMWIYENDSWIPVINDIKELAYHSAVFLDYCNSLCISGGICAKKQKSQQILENKLKYPSSLYTTEPFQVSQEIIIFNFTTFEKQIINPTLPKLTFGCSTALVFKQSICMFGGKDENGDNRNELYLINLSNGNVSEMEKPVKGINKFSHDSFICDSKLFVFSGFVDNEYSGTCWIYDFDHSTWLYFDTTEYIEDPAFLVQTEKGF